MSPKILCEIVTAHRAGILIAFMEDRVEVDRVHAERPFPVRSGIANRIGHDTREAPDVSKATCGARDRKKRITCEPVGGISGAPMTSI